MATGDLNPDIVDHIIELVYDDDDAATLTVCTQVCRLWHLFSRRFTFRTIQISTGRQLAEFEALLLSDAAIGPLVRKLRIQPRVPGHSALPSPWIAGVPRILPSKLTELHHIELVNLCETGRNCHNAFFRAFLGFSSVERLTVRDVDIGVHLLFAFITSLPKLKHVSVGSIRPLLASVFPYPVQILEPALTSLELNIGVMYPFGLGRILHWVGGKAAERTLRSLSIDVYDGQIAEAGEYLLEHGGPLEHLSLNIRSLNVATPPVDDFRHTREIISLSACNSLQTLTIHGFNPASSPMLSLVQEISSPEIRELTLEMTHSDDPQAMKSIYALVDVLEGNRDLNGLEKLAILYRDPTGGGAESVEYLRTELNGSLCGLRGGFSVTVLR